LQASALPPEVRLMHGAIYFLIDDGWILYGCMDFEAFSTDVKTVKAVELDLFVIGKTTNRIPDRVQEMNPQIPWALMRAMRNRLVHVYFSIDAGLLWDTVQNDLPALETTLKPLLN
jgi:uncharacterized protein with HEPN domain